MGLERATILPPGTPRNLDSRISRAAAGRGATDVRIKRAVANAVVAQMLPSGVVKGGTAMQLRRGQGGARFTPDLDASRGPGESVTDYIDALAERLAEGWSGFTGRVAAMRKPQPEGVPDDYIMDPFEIALAYKGRHWLTVEFELGRDEVGSTLAAEPRMAREIVELFRELGLPEPRPVPVMSTPHQIAQKIHACTYVDPKTHGNDRAHDLLDLQLLVREPDYDPSATRAVARRLFEARRNQAWPPVVKGYATWPTIYAKERSGLDVISDSAEAVIWANALIAAIDAADGS